MSIDLTMTTYLDELWCNPSDKNVPYCPSDLWSTDKLAFVFLPLTAATQFVGHQSFQGSG
jgi:hypothetical protein